MSRLAPTLEAFFTERLVRQCEASENTIAAYRDTMCLFVGFASKRLRFAPSALDFKDLDASLVAEFLDYLERQRGNTARTRNARFSALRSLFRFAALRHPEHSAVIEKVLAIPAKRHEKRLVTFLDEPEVQALLSAPELDSRIGRRDYTMLVVAVQTGLRISELIGLRRRNVHIGRAPHIDCLGKGRKQRITPITSDTKRVLSRWIDERGAEGEDFLFTSSYGKPLSRDAVERRVSKYHRIACQKCGSLRSKSATIHTLRHTAAMRLLHAGVDTSVIALWLGHEGVETTQVYLHADLRIKETALAKANQSTVSAQRFQPHDSLLAFLEGL